MCIKFECMVFRKEKKKLHGLADFKDMMPKPFPGSPCLTHKGRKKQTNTPNSQAQAPFAAANIKLQLGSQWHP